MALPVHSLHIFEKPAAGTDFLRRFTAYNYQHTIANQGWFDTASCDIAVRSQGEGFNILNNYLGNFIRVFVDNPAQPIWEGLINRLTFNAGNASYTAGLDELANRVSVVYTGAANAAAETTVVNNTTSQALYGIKQDQIEFGPDPSAGTHRTVLGNTILAQRAFPQTSYSQAQGQSNLIHMELIGIHHTLKWEKLFSAAVAGTSTLSGYVIALLGLVANGTTFFNNADTTKVTTNADTTPNQQRGKSYWERMLEIAEAGDGSNYWVCGILPTDANIGTRSFYYRIANYAVEYTAFQKDGLKPRNAWGKPIPPWLVVPDRVIRVEDQVVGISTALEVNPILTYIQSIQYDANTQKVQWFGADNTTARAAFMLNRSFKPIARDLGAPKRVIVT